MLGRFKREVSESSTVIRCASGLLMESKDGSGPPPLIELWSLLQDRYSKTREYVFAFGRILSSLKIGLTWMLAKVMNCKFDF